MTRRQISRDLPNLLTGTSRPVPRRPSLLKSAVCLSLLVTFVLLPVQFLVLPLNMSPFDVWNLIGLLLSWLYLMRVRRSVRLPYIMAMWLVLLTSFMAALASPNLGVSLSVILKEIYLYVFFVTLAAGLIYALYFTSVKFDQGFQLGLIAFTAAVLGGIGNLPGAVLGALIIGLIQAFNNTLTWHAPGGDWTQSIVFAILILILVFRPEGLLGERTPEGG